MSDASELAHKLADVLNEITSQCRLGIGQDETGAFEFTLYERGNFKGRTPLAGVSRCEDEDTWAVDGA